MSQKTGPLSSGRTPINFSASVSAGAYLQLPYKINAESLLEDVIVNFALNQQRLLQVTIYIGPQGTYQDAALFDYSPYSIQSYLVGDNNQLVYHDLNVFLPAGYYLTVAATNTDAVNPHTLDVRIVIKRVEATV